MCKTENSLDLSLDNFKFIFENIEVGFCIYDAQINKIIFANKYFSVLVNLEIEEILGLEDPLTLLDPNYFDYFNKYMNILLNNLDESDFGKKYIRLRRIKKSTFVRTKFRMLKFEQGGKKFLLISAFNITDLFKRMDKLDDKAQTDSLTGICNRFSLEDKFKEISQTECSFGAIMFDIDNFKHFNDTFGHNKGDEILK
ncbi:diguanylate cyclase, partial [Thermodesulfobium sp. 4217-1]|uniref:sensor domain-containing diguanylate cyclase n=1 Tax=Thermodesulfobium sp. 4217-1 TaxID=3120013 RepID=UPI0032217272